MYSLPLRAITSEDIYQICLKEDLEGLQRACRIVLDSGIPLQGLTEYDAQETTLLHIAIRAGFTEGLQYLLEQGLNPNQTDSYSEPCMLTALAYIEDNSKLQKVLNLLINFGAQVDWQKWDTHQSPLHLALIAKKYDCVKLFLEKTPNLHHNNIIPFKFSPLLWVFLNADIDAMPLIAHHINTHGVCSEKNVSKHILQDFFDNTFVLWFKWYPYIEKKDAKKFTTADWNNFFRNRKLILKIVLTAFLDREPKSSFNNMASLEDHPVFQQYKDEFLKEIHEYPHATQAWPYMYRCLLKSFEAIDKPRQWSLRTLAKISRNDRTYLSISQAKQGQNQQLEQTESPQKIASINVVHTQLARELGLGKRKFKAWVA